MNYIKPIILLMLLLFSCKNQNVNDKIEGDIKKEPELEGFHLIVKEENEQFIFTLHNNSPKDFRLSYCAIFNGEFLLKNDSKRKKIYTNKYFKVLTSGIPVWKEESMLPYSSKIITVSKDELDVELEKWEKASCELSIYLDDKFTIVKSNEIRLER